MRLISSGQINMADAMTVVQQKLWKTADYKKIKH